MIRYEQSKAYRRIVDEYRMDLKYQKTTPVPVVDQGSVFMCQSLRFGLIIRKVRTEILDHRVEARMGDLLRRFASSAQTRHDLVRPLKLHKMHTEDQ